MSTYAGQIGSSCPQTITKPVTSSSKLSYGATTEQNRQTLVSVAAAAVPSDPAPDTAVAVVADTDGISKANGSQKLISERDFCLGAPLRLLLLLCRCVVVVGRHGRCACCLRRRCRRENRKRDIFLPPIPFPSEPLALMFGGHRG